MARKRFLVSSAGGIAAGAPFALNSFLYISQVSPPVAASTRLARLADATSSIIAPGPGGSANSLVLGEGSTEGANAARSIVLGFNLSANSAAGSTDQVMIGNGISGVATRVQLGAIVIGGAINLDVASGIFDGVVIGFQAALTTGASHAGTVLIGGGATSREGNSVVVGAGATVTAQSVAIGRLAGNGNAAFVAVGDDAKCGNFGVTVGFDGGNAAAASTVIVGHSAAAGGAQAIGIGRLANAAFDNSIAIGYNSAALLPGDIVFGTDPNFPVLLARFGPGLDTLGTYPGFRFQFTEANVGSLNTNAPSTTFQGGLNTGNATVGGRLIFSTGTQLAGGVATQAAISRFEVASGGVVGIPTIRFVNQISTPGARAGTILNTPGVSAGLNPVVWMEVLINGVLSYIPAWQ